MGYSAMGVSDESLDWDDFHPVGDVMTLFWLGTDCHKTAFAEDLDSDPIQTPLLQWDSVTPPISKAGQEQRKPYLMEQAEVDIAAMSIHSNKTDPEVHMLEHKETSTHAGAQKKEEEWDSPELKYGSEQWRGGPKLWIVISCLSGAVELTSPRRRLTPGHVVLELKSLENLAQLKLGICGQILQNPEQV
ncbi:hypothetical protein BTVI_128264 [Pitangus sulphuratus]|nr:hypothetical protein BTVI_128264 [Pitangus sulphuratus]